jgi:glycosyltransferase involved in cell wall biosynthesis
VLFYRTEKKLPTGIRHCFYFLRVVLNIRKADLIIALDTFSAGLPSVIVSKIFKKKCIVRLGGDFLWESYVEKTGHLLTIREFYRRMPLLPFRQKMIFLLSKFVLQNFSAIVFSTEWQKDIFKKPYGLDGNKVFVVENFYGGKLPSNEPKEKNFVWAGRDLKLKNLDILRQSFELAQKEKKEIKLEISEKISHEELMEKLKNCYAVILSSLSDISPNFILETIMFNKPFILTKETGLYEKLKDVGTFVDPLDKEDIKNKTLFLAKDKNYNEYKNRVANFNFTHSWQEIAGEFLGIYKNL